MMYTQNVRIHEHRGFEPRDRHCFSQQRLIIARILRAEGPKDLPFSHKQARLSS